MIGQEFYYMRMALELAHKAFQMDEVPIGAIITHQDKVIGKGYNQVEKNHDPTAHAEIIAIRDACSTIGKKRLIDCNLYVTIEPCVMCAGALWQARIRKVYFGSRDPKGGAYCSLYRIGEDNRLNHQVAYQEGILEQKCRNLIQQFFRNKRKSK